MKIKLLILSMLFCINMYSQDYIPKNDGVKSSYNAPIAFTNATIYVNPNKSIKNGTLLVYKGKIIGVGNQVKVPKNTIEINLEGKYVYPSFIDIYSSFGIESPKKVASSGAMQYDASREGYYWNDHIRPETNPIKQFRI